MPQLKDFRRTKKVALPSIEGSEVEIVSSLLVRDVKTFKLPTEGKKELTFGDVQGMIPGYVVSWNLTDEKDQVLPVNEETIGRLTMDDLSFLFDQINSFAKDEGKV